MAKRPDTALYYTTVVAISADLAVIGGHLYLEGAEPTITRVQLCHGNKTWNALYDIEDIVYAATKKPGSPKNPRGTICLLGRKGFYRETISGSPPADAQLDTEDGYLMDLRYIGEHLYACGVQNQVHRQVGKRWQRMDLGTFAPLGDEVDRSFESIDGFAEDDIYAVGMSGAIWHWDGKRWAQLDSPTNYPLFCVLCSSTGDVYLGGSKGLIFKGSRDRGWEDLSNTAVTEEVLEDMTEFQGKVYVTATEALVATDGGPIEAVSVPVRGRKAYYAIDSVPDALWCVGDQCVLRFDGQHWEKFIDPNNT